MAIQKENSPRRLFLVSVPRTASNLLVQILNIQQQPRIVTNEKSGYFFYSVYSTAVVKGYFQKPFAKWTDAEKADMRTTYQQCLDSLEAASAQARKENKIMFTKEHAFWFVNPARMLDTSTTTASNTHGTTRNHYSRRVHQGDHHLQFPARYGTQQTFSKNNKTIFPDEYLRTWRFAFIIRHPALAWPSLYRAMDKISKTGFFDEDGAMGTVVNNSTWKWTRYLYDWCSEHSGSSSRPLILDAHDIIHSQEVVLRFCEQTGLDKDVLRFEWEAGKRAWRNGASKVGNKAADIMLSTLKASSGIIKEKTPRVVEIDVEVEKWREEFGVEEAALLERLVRDAMPDYEYLRERSLRA